MDETLNVVQMQDRKKCCEYACRAVLGDRKKLERAAAVLRPVVLQKIKTAGVSFFKNLLDRNAKYLALPKPLRGKALETAARQIGLVTRVKTVKVDVATLKDECMLARGREQMNMRGEIGRHCKLVVVHKTKRRECIKRIVTIAPSFGGTFQAAARLWLEWRCKQ